MFDQLVVSAVVPSRTNKPWTVALSAVGQSLLLGLLILVPLIYTEALPNAMLKTLIVAPPPPAPSAPVPLRTSARVRVVPLSHISAPRSIPNRISTEANEPPTVYVEGASGGSSETDALRDLLRPSLPTAPPPPGEQPPQRIRVGGNVEAASLLSRVVPQYPAMAIAAHVSGTVVLHAVIARDGTVQELTYVSGPALLLKAARDAVRQWRYRPPLLNGQPVEVETTIDVVFNLGS
jgi:periplasmic protein TonB